MTAMEPSHAGDLDRTQLPVSQGDVGISPNDWGSDTAIDRMERREHASADDEKKYDLPERFANLNEISAGSAVDADKSHRGSGKRLERALGQNQKLRKREQGETAPRPVDAADLAIFSGRDTAETDENLKKERVSKLATQIYTLSYLIFFSLLGTLARVGLTALTEYPGAPVVFSTIWANFGGSLIMGFLAEDRMLFRYEWGTPTYDQAIAKARQRTRDEEGTSSSETAPVDLAAAKKAHLSTKKTIPLYIGLATGFCGSFTSFSTFIRDVFLALSNDMVTPGFPNSPKSRNGGYSFMALLAVIITTVCLSLSGLILGAHLAIASEPLVPSVPYPVTRKVLDRAVVLLGWGCWLGAVLLAVFPPHELWRGRAIFSLVFAPLGCLARFYLSLYLNSKVPSFPLGTFAANVLGTAVLGMSWDIAHVQSGGMVGCQVLQGVEDGFCGCLTTISTWVAELNSLGRKHSYMYGTVSVVVSLAFMIVIMGGLRWTHGFDNLLCFP